MFVPVRDERRLKVGRPRTGLCVFMIYEADSGAVHAEFIKLHASRRVFSLSPFTGPS